MSLLAAVLPRQYLIWLCCGRVCVCVRERERERICVMRALCVCVCVCVVCARLTVTERERKGARFPEENGQRTSFTGVLLTVPLH